MQSSRIPQALYDSKISFSISCLWDHGFEVKLGFEPNFKETTTVRGFAEACQWLGIAAVKHYPDSTFAKTYLATDSWLTAEVFSGLIDHLVAEVHRLEYNWELWCAVDHGFETHRAEIFPVVSSLLCKRLK